MTQQYNLLPRAGPSLAEEWLEIGLNHHCAGRMAEAEQAYLKGLRLDPACVRIMTNLGVLTAQLVDAIVTVKTDTMIFALPQGQMLTALQYFERAVLFDDTDQVLSVTSARDFTIRSMYLPVLEGLGRVAAEQGELAWAARLWGAARALREAIGTSLPTAYRAEYEQAVIAARTQLGEQAFASAMAEGSTLTGEQAVVFSYHGESRTARRMKLQAGLRRSQMSGRPGEDRRVHWLPPAKPRPRRSAALQRSLLPGRFPDRGR